jgi:hypothetical protein
MKNAAVGIRRPEVDALAAHGNPVRRRIQPEAGDLDDPVA